MSNVPTSTTAADLPACGEPATTRIELFAARDGRAHGSLDGVMYLCDRHADEFVEAANWDSTGTISPHRTALTDRDILCGNGWDFVTGKAIEPERAAAAVLGDDHPIVNTAVEALRAFGDDLSREDATRLLSMWEHGKELSDRERSAVLAQFPEVAEGTDQKGSVFERTPALGSSQVQVEEQPKEETTSFNALVEAYRLGQAYGARLSDETLELLARLDARLRDAAEAQEKAHADGYVDGLSAAIEDGRIHAFTVEAAEEPDKFRWLCGCRWVTYQYPAGTEQVPIQQRLMEHVAEATAVDARTARALDADTCSCPPEVGDHRHLLYIRHPISGGKVHEIVVDSLWLGERMELLCWPLSVQGVALAARWVGEYAAQWDDGSPVVAEDLRRRAARWLR